MQKDFKLMLAALGVTFLFIVGFASLQDIKGNAGQVLSDMQGISVDPQVYDLSDVPINGGIVTKEYEVANTTREVLKLKKIATSCMCTEARVIADSGETKFFGMEHATDKNPPVNLEIAPGETVKVIVNFDPAAHGPQGVGPFERSVWLTFSDPAGLKELKFFGKVISG
jgi:hypothetical protein